MTERSITTFNANAERFPQELADAYQSDRVFDPDFSLAQDPAFYAKLQRDPVILGLIQFRKQFVAGSEWHLEPASETDVDKRAAAIVEEIISRIHRFSEVRCNLSEAFLRGATYEFMGGGRESVALAGEAEMDWWIPRHLKQVDKRRFRLANLGTEANLLGNGTGPKRKLEWLIFNTITRQYVSFDRRQFITHIYSDVEEGLEHGFGLANALFFYFRAKVVVLKEGLMGVERWAQGWRILKVDTTQKRLSPDQTIQQVVNDALQEMQKHRGRHEFAIDKNDELEVKDGPSTGSAMVQNFLNYLDDGMAKLILGSTLPTGGGGASGSLARAEVEERSTEALIRYDRKLLEETLERDLIGLVWRMNRPNFIRLGLDGVKRPFFRISTAREDTPQAKVALMVQLLQAGVPIREDEVYNGAGLTPPQEGDKVITAPAAAAAPFSAQLTGTTHVDQVTTKGTPDAPNSKSLAAEKKRHKRPGYR